MKRCILLFTAIFVVTTLSARLPDLIPYRKHNLWGYADSARKIIIPCQFDEVNFFYSDSARVKLKGQYGYVRKNGVFHPDGPPQIDSLVRITDFHWSPVTTVSITSPFNYLQPWSLAVNCGSYPCPVRNERTGLYGYKDSTGKIVIPYRYQYATAFEDGMAVVQLDGAEQAYINTDGTVVRKFSYAYQLSFFYNGLAVVTTNKKSGLINKSGVWVLPPMAEELVRHRNIFIAGSGGDYVCLNSAGQMIGTQTYTSYEVCENDLVKVETGGRFGFLKTNGKPLTAMDYKAVYPFKNGFAAVSLDGTSWGFINQKGKVVIPLGYNDPGPGFDENGLCKIAYTGYIDVHGKEYWED